MRRQVTFEIWTETNFLKQWQNVTANCLQRLRLRLLNISEISKRCCILHLHHQWNSEILCKFFALGLHTLNSRQQIAGTYKIKLTQAEFKGGGYQANPNFLQFSTVLSTTQPFLDIKKKHISMESVRWVLSKSAKKWKFYYDVIGEFPKKGDKKFGKSFNQILGHAPEFFY